MGYEELLKAQFMCCRSFVASSNLFPGASSPAQWLRLQALDFQATSGPCTLDPPSASDIEGRALWYDRIFFWSVWAATLWTRV